MLTDKWMLWKTSLLWMLWPVLDTWYLTASLVAQLVKNPPAIRRPLLDSWVRSSLGEGIGYPLQDSWASLVAQMVKESECNAGDLSSIPGLGSSPGGGQGNPLQYSCQENHHGQRSLVGYSHGVAKSQIWLSD